MTRRTQDFQTIRSEGGLLPADLLRRVLDRDGKLAGTRPEDYGLPPGERLNEAITQSWNRLRKHWAEFQAARSNLPENEAGTGLTNERWNLPLLRELDFGLLPASAGPEIDGRTYAISRLFGPVPVHLIGCGLSLDRRAAGQRGAAVANPHGLVQEFLNRSDAHLWALLSNGLRLRVLRDNQALSRQSFLEFDLEAMFSGEVYSDFVLLWLVAHATRLAPREGDRPETCWLEQWAQEAEAQGVAALKALGEQVERALVILGEGFTSHPKNTVLRDSLRSATLQPTELHAQLLRVVYRLIFLFVAEDRTLEGQSLLHPPDDSEAARTARARYAAHYSSTRLREMAGRIKGSRHGDLWKQFQLLVAALAGDAASQPIRQQLAMPALGSFLWDPASTPDLNDAELTNFDLLEALRHLAFTRQGKVLRPVDYRNLGAEELGGVYESLLALTPQVSGDGARFSFAEFAGNERKTSGSYYTPDSLVQCLLDSALDPVVEAAIKGKSPAEAEAAILALKVCDPAVGSGHFLVGAAHRLARHLARVRALAEGEGEPSPVFHQHALRDVIGRCLYGVDLNAMAAELCRVSLWLEALEPGKPLSFLDHHIRVGNSLLGTTPELIAGGLPDDAFKPIEGDDKKICAAYKKRNKHEREGGQVGLGLPMVAEPRAEYETLASRSRSVDQAPDDSLEAIRRKAEQFSRLVVSPEYRHRQMIADAWCAAFVWPKTPKTPEPITTETIRRLEEDPGALDAGQEQVLEQLSNQYQFFHWQLAFPEVFSQGGFDCVLGNPPWEQLEQQTENRADPLISGLQHFLEHNGNYRHTSKGRKNLYGLFVELGFGQVSSTGRLGFVVPTGFLQDLPAANLASKLSVDGQLVSAFDFENRRKGRGDGKWFPDAHPQQRFILLTLASDGTHPRSRFVFDVGEMSEILDEERAYFQSFQEIDALCANAFKVPMFRSRIDARIAEESYGAGRTLGTLLREECPTLSSGLVFNAERQIKAQRIAATNSRSDPNAARVYEGSYIHQFDHRFATYEGRGIRSVTTSEKADADFLIGTEHYLPRKTIEDRLKALAGYSPNWFVVLRRQARATDSLISIASIVPFSGAEGSVSAFFFEPEGADLSVLLCASFNSLIFNYLTRLRQGGANLNKNVYSQLPFLRYTESRIRTSASASIGAREWLVPRVLELTYTAWDVQDLAVDCEWDGPPFRWDKDRRFLIRCELDAAFFHLYLKSDKNGAWLTSRATDSATLTLERRQTPRHAVEHILDTFPILRRAEESEFGEYRTKRVILEIYDAMQEAFRTGQPYKTLLDPPPGPPVGADGNFVSYTDIADDPLPHIHLPRDAVPGSNVALQLPDLATHFPDQPFRLRLNTGADARVLRVRPVRTSDLAAEDTVVLASPNLQHQGAPVQAVVGRLRVESRTDAGDGSTYLLVSVRGNDGMAQASFSEDEWQGFTTVGVVMDGTPVEGGNG